MFPLLFLIASVAVKVNKLKKLKCVKVKVGIERDSSVISSTQDVNKFSSLENQRQLNFPAINSSMNVQLDSAQASSFGNHTVNLDGYSAVDGQRRDSSYQIKNGDVTSRDSSLANGDSSLPLVNIVPDENHVPGRVLDMSEHSSNVYRTSTESPSSQTTGLQLSSHQQLVDVESAREAAVSILTFSLFTFYISFKRKEN